PVALGHRPRRHVGPVVDDEHLGAHRARLRHHGRQRDLEIRGAALRGDRDSGVHGTLTLALAGGASARPRTRLPGPAGARRRPRTCLCPWQRLRPASLPGIRPHPGIRARGLTDAPPVILFLHNRYRVTGGEERAVDDLLWLAREHLGEEAEL